LHGNKGSNISNIESFDMKNKLEGKQDEVTRHYKEGHVNVSDFKPTQNEYQGHE
jgi:hypothetical protein